jgi:hypothetical protein
MDVGGCLWAVARCAGCMAALWLIMFLAILLAGALGIAFW